MSDAAPGLSRRLFAALILIGAVTFFAGLGGQAITDSDEGFYAEAGREMVAGGDWVTPHYNFDPRLQKPILFYWLVAATYEMTGVHEGAARFWSAASGLGLVIIAFAAGTRWFGPWPGFLGGLVAATSLGVTMLTRMSLPDGPLACFVSAAIWALLEALWAADRDRRRWVVGAAVAVALGILTKGPVAVVLPAIVVLPIALWERRRIPWADAAIGVGIVIAIAVPWFVAVTRARGLGYLHDFFVGENLERFATAKNNDPRPFGFYAGVITAGLLPWSPIAAAFGLEWAARGFDRKTIADPRALSLLAWFLAPLVFFMVSIGKQPRYVLPCLVPAAILMGRSLWARVHRGAGSRDARSPRSWWLAGGAAVSGLVLVAIGLSIARVGPILAAASPGWTPAGALALAAAGAAVVVSLLWRQEAVTIGVLAAAAVLAGLVVEMSVFSPGRPEAVERVAAAIRQDGSPGPVCACGAFTRNLTFYTGVPTVVGDPPDAIDRFLDRPERLFAAMDDRTLTAIEQRRGRAFPHVMDVPYLNVAALRLRSLIDPDPGRYLQRVVLITNR